MSLHILLYFLITFNLFLKILRQICRAILLIHHKCYFYYVRQFEICVCEGYSSQYRYITSPSRIKFLPNSFQSYMDQLLYNFAIGYYCIYIPSEWEGQLISLLPLINQFITINVGVMKVIDIGRDGNITVMHARMDVCVYYTYLIIYTVELY